MEQGNKRQVGSAVQRRSASSYKEGLRLKVESRAHSELELAVELSAMKLSAIWMSRYSSLLDRRNEYVIAKVCSVFVFTRMRRSKKRRANTVTHHHR